MYADLGRGLAQERGRDREAVEALYEAERIAPDLVWSTPLVRETVSDLLRRARRRAGGRYLTGLATEWGSPTRRPSTAVRRSVGLFPHWDRGPGQSAVFG